MSAPRTRNKGVLKAAACTVAGVQEDALRHKTIQCGIKNVLREPDLLEVFQDIAQKIGLIRYVSTLLTNRIISCMSEDQVKVAIEDKATGLKTFHSQMFVAVKCHCTGKLPRTTNPYFQSVAEILDRYPETKELVRNAALDLPYDVHQQEFVQMETASAEHVGQLRARYTRHFRIFILEVCQPHNVPYTDFTGRVDVLAKASTEAVLCPSGSYDSRELAMVQLAQSFPEACAADLSQNLRGEIQKERSLLGPLLDIVNYKKKSGEKATDSRISNMLIRGVKAREVKDLLPICIRLSQYQTQRLRHLESNTESEDSQDIDHEEDPLNDIIEGADDFDEEQDEPSGLTQPSRTLSVDRSRKNRPRPFSALPYAKLRPSMVYYGDTEIKALLSNLRTKAKRKSVKRKRSRADFEEPETQEQQSAEGAASESTLEFIKRVFDLGKFKGCSLATHSPIGFRTNGVVVSMTWGSAGESCVAALQSKGITIPEPASPIDLLTEERGLYRLGRDRSDICPCADTGSMLEIVAVDPGKIRPIQAAVLAPEGLGNRNWTPGSRSDISSWFVTREDYLDATGRTHSNRVEGLRRQKNPQYCESLTAIRSCRKRTCCPEQLSEYTHVALKVLPVMAKELVDTSRSKRGWVANRKRVSAFSRWVDKLLNRTSIRNKTPLQIICHRSQRPNQTRVDWRGEESWWKS